MDTRLVLKKNFIYISYDFIKGSMAGRRDSQLVETCKNWCEFGIVKLNSQTQRTLT